MAGDSQELLVAFDDTAAGRRAAAFAAERAEKTGERVDVVHIGSDVTETEMREAVEDSFLERDVPASFRTFSMGGSEDTNVSVSAKLAQVISNGDYAIVFMGNEKHGLFHNLAEASLTKALIEDQTVPITLVP
jgi:nucleotide-binding universal stress UspA family protein